MAWFARVKKLVQMAQLQVWAGAVVATKARIGSPAAVVAT